MPNPDFSEFPMGRKGRAKEPPATGKAKKGGDGFPVKPGFKTGAPGKKQPGKRSGGTPRAKVYPTSDGL